MWRVGLGPTDRVFARSWDDERWRWSRFMASALNALAAVGWLQLTRGAAASPPRGSARKRPLRPMSAVRRRVRVSMGRSSKVGAERGFVEAGVQVLDEAATLVSLLLLRPRIRSRGGGSPGRGRGPCALRRDRRVRWGRRVPQPGRRGLPGGEGTSAARWAASTSSCSARRASAAASRSSLASSASVRRTTRLIFWKAPASATVSFGVLRFPAQPGPPVRAPPSG